LFFFFFHDETFVNMFLFANSGAILIESFLYVMGIEKKSIPENERKVIEFRLTNNDRL